MKKKPDEKYLTPKEVIARWTNILKKRYSINTLQQWRSRGTGPRYSKPNGKVYYPLSELKIYERDRFRTRR